MTTCYSQQFRSEACIVLACIVQEPMQRWLRPHTCLASTGAWKRRQYLPSAVSRSVRGANCFTSSFW